MQGLECSDGTGRSVASSDAGGRGPAIHTQDVPEAPSIHILRFLALKYIKYETRTYLGLCKGPI